MVNKMQIREINKNELDNFLSTIPHSLYQTEEYATTRKNVQRKMIEAVMRPVGQYDLQDNLIQEYESGAAASRATGISQSLINAVCHQEPGRKTAGGYKWKFQEGSTTNE